MTQLSKVFHLLCLNIHRTHIIRMNSAVTIAILHTLPDKYSNEQTRTKRKLPLIY